MQRKSSKLGQKILNMFFHSFCNNKRRHLKTVFSDKPKLSIRPFCIRTVCYHYNKDDTVLYNTIIIYFVFPAVSGPQNIQLKGGQVGSNSRKSRDTVLYSTMCTLKMPQLII